VLDSQG
ncbi:hypothetical protein MKD33_01130, partial [Chromobacterium piscinae]